MSFFYIYIILKIKELYGDISASERSSVIVKQRPRHVHSSGLSWKERKKKKLNNDMFFITLTATGDKSAQIVSSHHICSVENLLRD